jgi:dolichyl-diphosphooligosaccharide--protein glycosyltransferase
MSLDGAPGESGSRIALLLFLAALLATFAFSLQPRLRQYREWTESPAEYFSEDVVVSSADSYRWFRFAKEARAGSVDFSGRDALRAYPAGVDRTGLPVLSRLMAWLADSLGTSVYRAGMILMIPLSSLFVIPLGFYLFRLGFPLVGLWGGLIGSFSAGYVVRSYVHRVDTDGGNLFFLWSAALCIAGVSSRSGLRANVVMAVLAGLTLHAFTLWYTHPGFVLAFLACLLLHLIVSRFAWHTAALLFATCAVFANPFSLLAGFSDLAHFIREYLIGGGVGAAGDSGLDLVFPSLLQEIGELRRVPFRDSLARVLDPPGFALFGLVAFGVFAVRNWRAMIPLSPLLALAALGIFRSVRFLMYLAPFIGIGIGYALTVLLQWGQRRVRGSGPSRETDDSASSGTNALREAWLYAVGLLAFAPLLGSTAYSADPDPRVTTALIASLQRFAETLPRGAAVAHTWGHGYLVADVTGGATFNDGELLDAVVEQQLDRGLASDEPRELHDVVTFLAARGRAGVDELLAEVATYPELITRIDAEDSAPQDPLFLLLTDKMAHEFSHYFRKGRFDGSKMGADGQGYDFRSCRPQEDARLRCEKPKRDPLIVDPVNGTINGRPVVAKFLRIRDGAVVEESEYAVASGLYLQLLEGDAGDPWEIQILRKNVYETNFNQMFVLGRYDENLFARIHDEFPVARAYEVMRRRVEIR